MSVGSGLQIETTLADGVVTARFTATAEPDPDPDGFPARLHDTLRQAQPTRVLADFRALELVSAAALKQLASWLVLIHEVPAEQQYPVEIVASPDITWQRRTLAALRCFAEPPDVEREPNAAPVGVPETIVGRFRALSLEKIARVESVCSAAFAGSADPETIRQAARDLHTLKGDAGIIGFSDVRLLAHKLEELFAVAGQHQYRVAQDFELVFALALQLAHMVVRKQPGVERVDLQRFISHVDDLLGDARAEP